MIMVSSNRSLMLVSFLTLALSACATVPEKEAADQTAREKDLQSLVDSLNGKVRELEGKLSTMQSTLSDLAQHQKAVPAPVSIPASTAANGAGFGTQPDPVPSDPEAELVNDDSIQDFRKAMILFKADRFSDSIIAFSNFLEKYPDHPIAGAAQFHLGKSYFNQKEYKLAIKEFQRVLTSYDRSSHVAATLRDMADAEDQLKETENAARHRQLLHSLFPHSPFAISKTASLNHFPAIEPAVSTGAHDPIPNTPETSETAPQVSGSEPPNTAPTVPLDPIPAGE